MSAYGREMEWEREYSAQSLPSRGGSEMESRYTTEAGIFMSSFAATIFISGLVTFGVSLLSLLVSLTVMLQSCQNKNSGVVEMYRYTDNYDYCRSFALHAELNSLGAHSFPAICKDVDTVYIKEGLYRRDLNITVGIAEDFFSSIRPQKEGRDVVLMDADDLAIENLYTHRIHEDTLHNSSKGADYLKHIFSLKLYLKLQSEGWPLILFSRKHEKLHNATVEYLMSMGCRGWSSLIMRMEKEMQIDSQEFLSRRRISLQRTNLRIVAVISSQMDALRGPCLGDRIFKLPNPISRHSIEDRIESRIQKSK
ncbi:hypothetical protein BUALT_Bualt01G0045800 [Buddleja alternifolia]|uniref:Acid phosphatase n=1 Tax=Buddleja alternifolia TaxID=168488 RepID=A0AAV6YB33_9LAMI|nr:hypothetical protein BUALT_Bualt01G0045800 [Buddleja alternifolia]